MSTTANIDLTNELYTLPDRLAEARAVLLQASNGLTHAQDRLRREKARIARMVTAERGEDGKPVYTNETARNAAIEDILDTDGYGLQVALEEAQRAKDEATLELQHRQDTFAALRAIARLVGNDG